MKRNKGFSLIEVLVIVAIMGVGLGLASMSIASLSSADVRRCAVDMNSMLSKARVNSMYRDRPVLEISLDADSRVLGTYYEGGVEVQREFLGRRGGYTGVNVLGTDLLPGGSVFLGFRRGTGRLVVYTSANGTMGTDAAGTPSITITRGTVIYTIDFVAATGRHTVVRG
jgi:prepilin-type N-terminal cleavage/methylation domain-containing protein